MTLKPVANNGCHLKKVKSFASTIQKLLLTIFVNSMWLNRHMFHQTMNQSLRQMKITMLVQIRKVANAKFSTYAAADFFNK